MADFQSFRNAVLESVELQEAVVSRINTAWKSHDYFSRD